MKRIPALLAAALATLTVAACGGGSDTAAPASTPSAANAPPADSTTSPAPSTEFNDADVTFAQMMIPHHRQAIEMAKLAATRAANPEVKKLATAIEGAQDPEIQTMAGWLMAWGKEIPNDSMPGMDHGGMGGKEMPGMMSEQDMKMLESMSGAAFDREWLTMMVTHHQGAMTMAQKEQKNGENPDAVALAKKIESDQAVEVATMKRLLGRS